MANNKNVQDQFRLKGAQKLNKNFMYRDLRRSNCYDNDFSGSNFDFTSFRGAHFKSCNFFECTFKSAEFVGTNLKKSKFKKAQFEDTIFDSVNLDGVDFRGAIFKNVIFLNTNLTKAINLDITHLDVRSFPEMPELDMSEGLEDAVKKVMENDYVKASRALDTKEGGINFLNIMLLLEKFDEETLIKGLNKLESTLDKDFFTLSYIIKAIHTYQEQGLI